MRSSAQALEIIKGHVSAHGVKMQLSEVLNGGSDEIAGLAVDRFAAVSVAVPLKGMPGRDPEATRKRLFPGGILTGTLACRAVLLEPGATERLTGVAGVEGALHLRTRFETEEPSIGALPPEHARSALSIGGTVRHVAVHNLLPGDGETLDDYYAALAAHQEVVSAVGPEEAGPEPAMPALRAFYGLTEPPVPNFGRPGDAERPGIRLDARRVGFGALQTEVPAARVLSVCNQGFISEYELGDWAEAFTAPEPASAV